MFEKLSNSWQLVKASARVLRADKELMVFPLVSGVALILVSVVFFLPLTLIGGTSVSEEGMSVLAYIGLFLFYVVQYSVIFFFNSALVGAAMIRLDGGDPTVKDGLRIATQRLPAILGYAVIAATVGMILRTARDRGGFLAKLVISLVGLGWNLATYLVVPVLVTQDVSPIDAIRESARVLKRTWGEQVVGNMGLGGFFVLMWVGLGVLFVPTMILVAMSGQGAVIVGVLVLFAALALVTALIQASLGGIYSAALYRFATQGDVAMFDSAQLQGAFRKA